MSDNGKQQAGCLPSGFDENSMLTPGQFAIWKQISLRTVMKRLSFTPGVVRHSRQDQRIHVKTYLAAKTKK